MLETQATVRSLTGVGGFNVDGDWEPWGEKKHTPNDHESMPIAFIPSDFLQAFPEIYLMYAHPPQTLQLMGNRVDHSLPLKTRVEANDQKNQKEKTTRIHRLT